MDLDNAGCEIPSVFAACEKFSVSHNSRKYRIRVSSMMITLVQFGNQPAISITDSYSADYLDSSICKRSLISLGIY